MATESIGKTVIMDNDFADRFIKMQEEVDSKPPTPRTREIRWGDPEKFAAALRRKYGVEK
jgi:hypothetical protein